MELDRDKIEKSISLIDALDYTTATIAEIEDILLPLFEGLIIHAPRYEPNVYINRSRIGKKPTKLRELSYPDDPKYITEYGRANDIGRAVFYGSFGKVTPFFEVGAQLNDTLMVSFWKTTHSLTLNHVGFSDEVKKSLNTSRDLASAYKFVVESKNHSDLNAFVQNFLASSYTKEISGDKRAYKLPIAITNRLWLGDTFDGILYPSVAAGAEDDNIILKTPFVDKHLSFVAVEFIQVTSIFESNGVRQYKYKALDSAVEVDTEGNIMWSGRHLTFDQQTDESAYSTGREYIYRDASGKRKEPKLGEFIKLNKSQIEEKFDNHFSDCIRSTVSFSYTHGQEEIICKASLCLRLDSDEKFIAAFVPDCIVAESVIVDFLNSRLDWVLDFEKGRAVQVIDVDGSVKLHSIDGMTFTKQVFVFSDAPLVGYDIGSKVDQTLKTMFFCPD